MAYIYDEPLNNRSGIGGKEKMEREEAVKAEHEQLEEHEGKLGHGLESEREADKAEAKAAKDVLVAEMEAEDK
ncbi:hypothetical protein HGI81_05370 [Olsenella sp. KGMB02461]|nr:hypothetical protein [Olsenella sp. KGMB02461]